MNNRELAAWIAAETKDIGSAEVGKIVETLTSLYRLRITRDKAIPSLVSDVVEASREIPGFKVAAGVDFPARLSALLALKSLNIIAVKAKELQIQSQRTFCEARIITDIRPIFGETVEDSPTATIIVHTLKIGFHDSASPVHRDIYMALDLADIKAFKIILERAEKKTLSLQTTLHGAGLKSVDLP
jgi:hypothetical protein